MATVTLRSVKGSALTFTEMDNNFSNINTDKLENIVEDTTPQLGGSLDVNGNSIISASNGDIAITPDGTGNVVLDGLNWPQADGSADYVLKTNGAGQLSWTAPTSGIADVVDDTSPQLGGNLDIQSFTITTSTTNGSILLQPNGSGFVTVDGGTGLAVDTGYIKANNTNANLTLSADGTGYILLNQVGGVIVTDTAASGNGVITGATSKGIALLTNAGASGVNDPQFALLNGGGISVSPGATSTTTFNGTNVSNLQLKDYKETVYTGGTTTGTITPDVANGNVQSITLSGNITFSAFGNPEAGQSMTLIVKQPSSGGPYTLTSTMKFAGGTKTLSTAADAIDIISVFYDGTDYWASLATAFA